MAVASAAALLALVGSTSVRPVLCQNTSETSTTTQTLTSTSTETSLTMSTSSDTWTTTFASTTGSSTQSTVSSTSTTTTVPGPFWVTQSIVFLSNGMQEEVHPLVLDAVGHLLQQAWRSELTFEFLHHGQCVGTRMGTDTVRNTREACGQLCQATSGCGYFAYDALGRVCALYTEAGGCSDDSSNSTFEAFRLILGPYERVTRGAQCGSGGGRVNFGTIRSPSECAARTQSDQACGDAFMFSHIYNYWGCRCCHPGDVTYNFGNSNWWIYRLAPLPIPATWNESYGNLTVAANGLELNSSTGEALAEFLEDFSDLLPDIPDEANLLVDTGVLSPLVASSAYYAHGRGHRLAAGGSGTLWRVDVEVIAQDKYTSGQLHTALNNLGDESTTEYASFSDEIQAGAAMRSLWAEDFLFSRPLVRGRAETTSSTQTTTATTTATALSGTQTGTSETDTTDAMATSMASCTCPSSETTASTPPVEDSTASTPPAEDSTSLVMAVAGGAALLLVGAVFVAIVALRRRKPGNEAQHVVEINVDVERAAASSTNAPSAIPDASGAVMEI